MLISCLLLHHLPLPGPRGSLAFSPAAQRRASMNHHHHHQAKLAGRDGTMAEREQERERGGTVLIKIVTCQSLLLPFFSNKMGLSLSLWFLGPTPKIPRWRSSPQSGLNPDRSVGPFLSFYGLPTLSLSFSLL